MRFAHHLLRAACIAALTAQIFTAQAQQWRPAPAYDKALAANVLDRSVLFLPLYGAVYRAKFVTAQSLEPGGMSRAEFAALLKSEEVRWGQLVRESGAKIE